MKCKYEGSGVWKDRCVGTKEVDPCIGYEKCERYRPNCKTNADHIRSMTDEELAMDIMHLNFCPPNIDEYKECGANANCHQCWVDWLKQPFGGGDT